MPVLEDVSVYDQLGQSLASTSGAISMDMEAATGMNTLSINTPEVLAESQFRDIPDLQVFVQCQQSKKQKKDIRKVETVTQPEPPAPLGIRDLVTTITEQVIQSVKDRDMEKSIQELFKAPLSVLAPRMPWTPQEEDADIWAAFNTAQRTQPLLSPGPPPGLQMPTLAEQAHTELETMQRGQTGHSHLDPMGIAQDVNNQKHQERSHSGKCHSSSQSREEADPKCGQQMPMEEKDAPPDASTRNTINWSCNVLTPLKQT